MATSLVIAAALTFAIGVVHSWLGEVRLIGPLLAPDRRQGILAKSEFARRTLRFAWHITTIAWWGLGTVLAALSWPAAGSHAGAVAMIVSATFLITGLITLIVSRGRHLAWPVFLAIGLLALAPVVLSR